MWVSNPLIRISIIQDGTNPIEAKKTHNSNLISKDNRINKESFFKSNIKIASNIQNAKY